MTEIEAGAIVRLRTGGPKMTVEEALGSNIYTVWFESRKVHRSTFERSALELIAPASSDDTVLDRREAQREEFDVVDMAGIKAAREAMEMPPTNLGRNTSHDVQPEPGDSEEGDD